MPIPAGPAIPVWYIEAVDVFVTRTAPIHDLNHPRAAARYHLYHVGGRYGASWRNCFLCRHRVNPCAAVYLIVVHIVHRTLMICCPTINIGNVIASCIIFSYFIKYDEDDENILQYYIRKPGRMHASWARWKHTTVLYQEAREDACMLSKMKTHAWRIWKSSPSVLQVVYPPSWMGDKASCGAVMQWYSSRRTSGSHYDGV